MHVGVHFSSSEECLKFLISVTALLEWHCLRVLKSLPSIYGYKREESHRKMSCVRWETWVLWTNHSIWYTLHYPEILRAVTPVEKIRNCHCIAPSHTQVVTFRARWCFSLFYSAKYIVKDWCIPSDCWSMLVCMPEKNFCFQKKWTCRRA